LVKNAPEENLPAMVVAKLLQFTKALSGRKWTDQEIVEDLAFLQEELQASFDQLTYAYERCLSNHRTFDEYSSELESGHLSWTPPHRSEDFWRENATKLIEQDNKLLKILARLLATSKNPVVLAVGCHDIGQLVKQVPQAIAYRSMYFVLILGKFKLLE
jgi:V-type H+-transporting ATPase subunit H